jgi:hypothetical protein
MANVLRYQTGSSRFRPFVGGLEPLDEREPMPAPPNASGILERNVIPEGDGGQFQLTPPGDLSMQPRDDTPTLDRLTLRNAPEPRLDYGPRRLSMVEGLPEVPPEPAMGPAPERAWGGPSSRDERDQRRTRRIDRAQAFAEFGERIGQLFQRPQDRQAIPQSTERWSAPITDRMEARQATGAAVQGGKIEAAADAEAQQYARGANERRLDLDERRIAQTEAATQQRLGYRDADIDPAHPNAANERRLYASAFAALPEHIRSTFPGYDPSNPNVAQVLEGLGAAQVRRNLDLLQDQLDTRFPDEADWRNTARSGGGGGRAHRGDLAGLAAPSRTVRRGDAGLTADQLMQMDAAGVDEMPVERPIAPAARPRAAGGAARPMRAPALQPGVAPQPGASTQAPAAPAGRALVDRPMTPEEQAQASVPELRTQRLAEAAQRRHLGITWRQALSEIPTQPTAQDALLNEWGSASTDRIPGWARVRDVPLNPAALNNAREAVTQFETIKSNVRTVLDLTRRINALNLSEDALMGHPLVQEWRSASRRVQTALRAIDNTGVPTGDEQIRAMQEAPEPRNAADIQSLLRAPGAYQAMQNVLGRNVGVYMQQVGYAPVRPGSRR